MEAQVGTRSDDRQNSVGSQKPVTACSGQRSSPSSPTSASASDDHLTRSIRQMCQPKPLGQPSDVNTVGGAWRVHDT